MFLRPFLFLVLFSIPGSAQPVELLGDPKFAEGFGAAFIYGSEYTGGRRPPLGKVTAYRDISPWQIHLIPDGPVSKIGVKTHPWDFQEGLHHNFTDSLGRKVKELHAHRLVVNHKIEVNTPEKLQFAQFNNYGLKKDHPDRDTKLVKRITSDRKGTLTVFYNSKNEIRNAATGHSPRWARDTWPHLLVNQRFLEPIALSDYEKIEVSVDYQVDQMKKLSNWPNAIKGAARSGMNLKFMFFLRNKKNLDQRLFAGMMLFTSRPKAWPPHLGVEQHGQVFYRDSVAPDGKNVPLLGEQRSVQRELKSLIAEALRQGREKQPALSANPDDYALYNFSIGFEGMGHWESEATISNLSCLGFRKALPPRPRIETDETNLKRAKERIAQGKEPFASYWNSARAEAEQALSLEAKPSAPADALAFHSSVRDQGIATRLLAYRWRLEDHLPSGEKAVSFLDSWASFTPLPGTNFDPKIRFPNAGMDVARGMLPFIASYDLIHGHPALTEERKNRIENWFRALVPVIKEGIHRWEENEDFGGQEFQNHHVAHVLGLALIGSTLGDRDLVQFALDSPENPKDFRELLAGLILMPDDPPHGGLRGKPLHPGEIQDRVRSSHGAGLTYCHLSMTMMLYAAEVLGRATGENLINEVAPGAETLRLPFTFYSDFFRLRNARINGDYYFRDQKTIQNNQPFLGIFEVALHHWPDVPNLKAVVRSMNRPQTPRTWLNYYGLPLLTHGVDHP